MAGSVVVAALLAIAAIAPAAAPSASPPAAAESPALKEIGRVRVTSPLCKALVSDAVRAIGIETENGRRLADVETALRTADLDANQIVKHRGTQALSRQYVDLRAAAVAGNGIMKHFREDAKHAPSEEQRAALGAFADALDGALHRQKTLADDVGRLIAYLDTHEPIDKDTHDRLVFQAILQTGDLRYPLTAFDPRAFGPFATVPDSLSTTAKFAAEELARRAQPIGGDEDAAAARIEPAFERC
ncbi:MAG: hypothetical protein NVS3B16_09770 [Vulcanimicrobiaceae bacterium]